MPKIGIHHFDVVGNGYLEGEIFYKKNKNYDSSSPSSVAGWFLVRRLPRELMDYINPQAWPIQSRQVNDPNNKTVLSLCCWPNSKTEQEVISFVQNKINEFYESKVSEQRMILVRIGVDTDARNQFEQEYEGLTKKLEDENEFKGTKHLLHTLTMKLTDGSMFRSNNRSLGLEFRTAYQVQIADKTFWTEKSYIIGDYCSKYALKNPGVSRPQVKFEEKFGKGNWHWRPRLHSTEHAGCFADYYEFHVPYTEALEQMFKNTLARMEGMQRQMVSFFNDENIIQKLTNMAEGGNLLLASGSDKQIEE
ncbi:MAG: hypothetical protein AAFO96_03575 [Bacteroidota bacterium]